MAQIKVLPFIVMFNDSAVIDHMVGFEDLGNKVRNPILPHTQSCAFLCNSYYTQATVLTTSSLTLPQDDFSTAALERRLARSGVIVDEKTKSLVQEKKGGIKSGSVASANDSSDEDN